MKLYAIKNLSTGQYIFSARGSAYKDITSVTKKMRKLYKENPNNLYRLVVFRDSKYNILDIILRRNK